MADPITVTELRADLYRVVDNVLTTGKAQRIRRGDRYLTLQPEGDARRLDLDRLPRRTAITCTPDELVEQGFADQWTPDL